MSAKQKLMNGLPSICSSYALYTQLFANFVIKECQRGNNTPLAFGIGCQLFPIRIPFPSVGSDFFIAS